MSELKDLINYFSAQLARKDTLELQQQQIALNLISKGLDREATLIDRQIARNEKKYDAVVKDYETTKEKYEKTTGMIYQIPDINSTKDVSTVLDQLGGSSLDSLKNLAGEIKEETNKLMVAKSDMTRKINQSDLISDFYKGYGHDFSAGDPDRWDPADFSAEELAKYMAKYPELEGVDQEAFFSGVKTRGGAKVSQTAQTLNAALNKAKSSKLKAASDQLTFDTQNKNVGASQIKADIENVNEGLHNMLHLNADYLHGSLFAPAIQASTDFAASVTEQIPAGSEELKDRQDEALKEIGKRIYRRNSQDTDDTYNDEAFRIGRELVLGNSNYINSIPGYLRGSGELDYIGYVNALQEIQMNSELARNDLESGAMPLESYLTYKRNIEQIVGTDLNDFASDMDILTQSTGSLEDQGEDLVIAGMRDSLRDYVPSVDYNIPENYASPIYPLAPEYPLTPDDEIPFYLRPPADNAAIVNNILPDSVNVSPDSLSITPDSTMIFPDSSTVLPNTTTTLSDSLAIPIIDSTIDTSESKYKKWDPLDPYRSKGTTGAQRTKLDVERSKLSDYLMDIVKSLTEEGGEDLASDLPNAAEELYVKFLAETDRMGNVAINDWSTPAGWKYMFFTRNQIMPDPIANPLGGSTSPALLNPLIPKANYPSSVSEEMSFFSGIVKKEDSVNYQAFIKDFEAFRTWLKNRYGDLD